MFWSYNQAIRGTVLIGDTCFALFFSFVGVTELSIHLTIYKTRHGSRFFKFILVYPRFKLPRAWYYINLSIYNHVRIVIEN